MKGPMAQAPCVAEKDLVRHKWEERPSVLRVFNYPMLGNARVSRWEWAGGGRKAGGGRMGEWVLKRRCGKGIKFEV